MSVYVLIQKMNIHTAVNYLTNVVSGKVPSIGAWISGNKWGTEWIQKLWTLEWRETLLKIQMHWICMVAEVYIRSRSNLVCKGECGGGMLKGKTDIKLETEWIVQLLPAALHCAFISMETGDPTSFIWSLCIPLQLLFLTAASIPTPLQLLWIPIGSQQSQPWSSKKFRVSHTEPHLRNWPYDQR